MKVTVKWGKEVFKDIEVEEGADSFDVLQAQLFALTSVAPERQKVLTKGKVLKDAASVNAIKAGAKLMLMGSADAVPTGPAKAVVFSEDLTDAQRGELAPELKQAPGLVNLENTCYMNSVLQCMKGCEPLKEAVKEYSRKPAASADAQHQTTKALGELFYQLDAAGESFPPHAFCNAFRSTFPRFAERSQRGGFMQHDAEEALTELTQLIATKVKSSNGASSSSSSGGNTVDELFQFDVEQSGVCVEAPEEASTSVLTKQRKMQCFINEKINHLHMGLKAAMEDEIEKASPTLGRNAVYKRSTRIASLPRFLTVQFMRFYFKVGTQTKCKMLKKVAYPAKLDLTEYCAEDLKANLTCIRKKLMAISDKKLGLDGIQAAAAGGDKAVVKKKKLDNGDAAAADVADVDDDKAPEVTTSGVTSGSYELYGIVTHKGREADGGHYIGWVREKSGSDKWNKFDDDQVSDSTTAEVEALAGGGDWHTAYLAFYRRVDDLVDDKLDFIHGKTLLQVETDELPEHLRTADVIAATATVDDDRAPADTEMKK